MDQIVNRTIAEDAGKRKRVLIISTYRTACGIAAFTDTLQSLLSERYAIEIGALDQFLLKNIDKAGDALIAELVKRAKSVDVVNLQWEPGLLGTSELQRLRRLKTILRATPNLVITAHTVLPKPTVSVVQALQEMRHNGLHSAVRYTAGAVRHHGRATYRALVEASRSREFQLIVHTRREQRFFRDAIGIRNVHDHPLSYIRKDWMEKLPDRASGIRSELVSRFGGRKFIGFFGFLSKYKGILTAVEAMRFLPDEYMLLLYGGVHPGEIKRGEVNYGYVEQIINAVDPPYISGAQQGSVVDRVQFLGAPSDFNFAAAMMACDINVFPYVEIGQSASGPVSQSVELGKRTIVSNNFMFNELDRYFPGRTERMDVGNYIHLAQVIMRAMEKPEPGMAGLAYHNRTLADFYAHVIEQASKVSRRKIFPKPLRFRRQAVRAPLHESADEWAANEELQTQLISQQ